MPIEEKIYFQNKFLQLSAPEQTLVNIIFQSIRALLLVFAAMSLVLSIKPLIWPSILVLLFFADLILRFNHPIKFLNPKDFGEKPRINSNDYLSGSTRNILLKSYIWAEGSVNELFYFYLITELVKSKEIKDALLRLDINIRDLIKSIDLESKNKLAGSSKPINKKEFLNKLISDAVNQALVEAMNLNDSSITHASLLIALLGSGVDEINRLFISYEISPQDLKNALIFSRIKHKKLFYQKLPQMISGFSRWQKPFGFKARMNRSWTSRPTKFLDAISLDLTEIARRNKIGFLMGHKEEFNKLVDILNRPDKGNCLLIGEGGSGKSSLIAYLAKEIAEDRVPKNLFDRRLIILNISDVIAGTKEVGEIQKKINSAIKEVMMAGNIILCIPDIHNLALTSDKEIRAMDLFKPVFASGVIKTIGTTTQSNYRTYIESDSEFNAQFEKIRIEEISEDEAIQILLFEALLLERQSGIFISYRAIKRVVNLAKRFFRDKLLPGSAVDLLEQAISFAKENKFKILTENIVNDFVGRRIKAPLGAAKEKEAKLLLNLEEVIHERLINQETAVSAIASAMRQYRAGLSKGKGPIASFLFVGPTGVGKTELSKILADIYFGGEDSMLRFDMSEYQDIKAIYRFIGSSDLNTPSILTEALKLKPYSLILLDEFEKAHPDILNLFLQVFDEGWLTDNFGNKIDFSNTIIIATSNVHSVYIQEEINKNVPANVLSENLKKKLTDYFKPELLNRFDSITVFRPLNIEEIEKISEINLHKLVEQVEKNQGVKITYNQDVLDLIAKLGWDPAFGARPLKGVINGKIKDPISKMFLSKEIKRGDGVQILVLDEKFQISKS